MNCKNYNMIDNSYISYTEYLAEALDSNSSTSSNKKIMLKREDSINKIFNID